MTKALVLTDDLKAIFKVDLEINKAGLTIINDSKSKRVMILLIKDGSQWCIFNGNSKGVSPYNIIKDILGVEVYETGVRIFSYEI